MAPSTGTHSQDLIHAAQQSFVDGWQQAVWAGAIAEETETTETAAARGPEP